MSRQRSGTLPLPPTDTSTETPAVSEASTASSGSTVVPAALVPAATASAPSTSSGTFVEHHFRVSAGDMAKYDSRIPVYTGQSRSNWVEFKSTMFAMFERLGTECRTWKGDSYERILKCEQGLSKKSTTLTRSVLIEKCKEMAEVKLRQFCGADLRPTLFAEMMAELGKDWGIADDWSYGWSLNEKLFNMRFKPGMDLKTYNREFQTLYTELVSMGFLHSGMPSVIIYLRGFQIHDHVFDNAKANILTDKTLRENLHSVILKLEQIIITIYSEGRFPVEATVAAAVTGNRNGKAKANARVKTKARCTNCGRFHGDPANCYAKDKTCHLCGQAGHISPCCPTKAKAKSTSPSPKVGIAHCAAVYSAIPADTVGVDSMAGIHVFNTKAFLTDLRPERIKVIVGKLGAYFFTEEIGTAHFVVRDIASNWSTLVIKDAYYAPEADMNVLSTGVLKQQRISVNTDDLLITTPDKVVIPITQLGTVFVLHYRLQSQPMMAAAITKCAPVAEDINLLHARLGHANWGQLTKEKLRALGVNHMFHGKILDCEHCIRFKAITEKLNSNGSSSDVDPNKFSVDIMKFQKSFRGHIGAIVIIDHLTRDVRIATITNRQKEIAQIFIRLLKTTRKTPSIKVILDRDGAFTSETFRSVLTSNSDVDVDLSFCPPHRHELNGMVERVIRTLREMTDTLLAHANLGEEFWPLALAHAAYIKRRLGHFALNSDSPFSRLQNKLPELSHLRSFGALTYYRVESLSKSGPKRDVGLYVGHDEEDQFGTILIFIPRTQTTVRRHLIDVTINESKFPGIDLDAFSDENATALNEVSNEIPPGESSSNEEAIDSTVSNAAVTQPDATKLVHKLKTTKRKFKARVPNHSESAEPNFFTDIRARSDAAEWLDAIQNEVADLKKRGTFDLVDVLDVPKGENILPSHFTFQAKRDGRKKARWVAGGNKQIKRLLEDFASPTLRTSSLFTLLAIGSHKRLSLRFLDIRNAYLWSDLPQPIYMQLPLGYSSQDDVKGQVCLLKKGLYGLKESGRLWFDLLSSSLKIYNLRQSSFDPCVFYNTDRNIFLGTYVDDLIILSSEEYADQIEDILNKRFETRRSDFDYLGVSISQDEKGFTISHRRYAEKLLERFGMVDCNPKPTPLPMNCMLTLASEEDRVNYPMQEAAGALLWLARYRPDLTFAAHMISKIASCPSQDHISVFKHVLQYVKGSLDFLMEFPFGASDASNALQLHALTDANWANDSKTRKSCGGSLVYAGDYLITFYAKTQAHVATSSTHAEVCEISRGSRHVVFLKNLLEELGFIQEPVSVYTDSQSAIDSISKLKLSEASKHYAVLLNEVKEYNMNGVISLKKIIREDNAADLLTNQRGKVTFQHLLQLMLHPIW